MTSQTVRWSEERFGGGQLAGHGDSVFQPDMILDRVHVIDTTELTVTATIELPYTPRALLVDASRDLLLIGDWLGGHVSLYRLSTLATLDTRVWAGPYLRDLAMDPAEGALFSASKCGVYQLDLDVILGAIP